MTNGLRARIGLGALMLVQLPFTISFAQADDSPGLGGLGMIVALAGLIMIVLAIRRARRHSTAATEGTHSQ